MSALSVDVLLKMAREAEDLASDPCEFRLHPLTMVGRYGQVWKKIEECNKGPFGPLVPVTDDEHIPEGLVVIHNLRPRKEPLLRIVDLRPEGSR